MSDATKGPWELMDERQIWAGDKTIADVLDTTEGLEGDDPEAAANARLIAASPDLLAYAECSEAWGRFTLQTSPGVKLEDVEIACRRHGWDEETQPDIQRFLADLRRAAITKATGHTTKGGR